MVKYTNNTCDMFQQYCNCCCNQQRIVTLSTACTFAVQFREQTSKNKTL